MNDMPRPHDATPRPRLRLDFTLNPINLGALLSVLLGAGYAYGQLTMRLGLLEAQSSQQAQQIMMQTDLMQRWVRTDEQVIALSKTVEKMDARIGRLEQR